MTDEITDLIYEAAFLPDLWPGVLDSLSHVAGAAGGAVIVQNSDRVASRQTPDLDGLMTEFCGPDTWQRVTTASYLRKAPPGAFVHGPDYFPEPVTRSDPLSSSCAARGMGNLIITLIDLPTTDTAFVVLERPRDAERPDDGVMHWLNGVRPHLARASMISARLRLEQARNTVQALSRVGLPAAVLNGAGAVLAANDRFEALDGPFRIGAFDRLSLNNKAANALFKDAVGGINLGTPTVKSIPLPARDEQPSMIVHVAPIARSAHDIFNPAACVVIATPVGTVDVPDGAMLNGLFDLSPAEARLVQKFSQGMTLNQISADLGLSVSTLRSQLRSVFAKTGTSRQAELAQLVGSINTVFAAN